MADMKAIHAGVVAYLLYKFALEGSVLPIEVVLITKLTPTVREDLCAHNSQFILGNFREKGRHGHFNLTLFDGFTCCCAMLEAVTKYSLCWAFDLLVVVPA